MMYENPKYAHNTKYEHKSEHLSLKLLLEN